jgi:hypothetical protein
LIEFVLDKPTEKIELGDKVKVSYVKKEGENVATMVSPIVTRKVTYKSIPQ